MTPRKELENAVSKSLKAPKLRVIFETNIQNKEVFSRNDYLSPNRFYLFEKIDGKVTKEIIEVGKEQFRRTDEKWVKMRLDQYIITLKEQFDLLIPVKFSSKKSDYVQIKRADVNFLGDESLDDKKCRKYEFSVSYIDLDTVSSGIVWVNERGLVERVEVLGGGLFCAVGTVLKYFYDEEIKIEAPKDFILEN